MTHSNMQDESPAQPARPAGYCAETTLDQQFRQNMLGKQAGVLFVRCKFFPGPLTLSAARDVIAPPSEGVAMIFAPPACRHGRSAPGPRR
jgi:hypothetical protein